MSAAPPLRFLAVVLGGWACARAAFLAPEWLPLEPDRGDEPAGGGPPVPTPAATARVAALPIVPEATPERTEPKPIAVAEKRGVKSPPAVQLAMNMETGAIALAPAPVALADEPSARPLESQSSALATAPPIAAALQSGPDRLAVSGWAIVRQGSGGQLAAGGTLGGSQAGVRATYRINQTLALSARVSSPLQGDGSEAAVGVEWQPVPQLPVKLLAERRQAIAKDGRSAFALLAHGGVSGVKVAGPVEAEAYAQAGVVGASRRDLFADGAVKLSVPVSDTVSVGAGAWGAAQPDLSRLDVGPQVTLTVPGGNATVKVSAEYRLRVAGDAAPGSGPAITVATSF